MWQKGVTISIHAPRGGSDKVRSRVRRINRDFNPRSPWGERRNNIKDGGITSIISIHAPRGGSDLLLPEGDCVLAISIHAPRGGSDLYVSDIWSEEENISIHAPRGGSDFLFPFPWYQPGYFNPRSPWGERQVIVYDGINVVQFQSTLPVGGATCTVPNGAGKARYFNPRSPWGERHKALREAYKGNGISIHAPRGGSDIHSAAQES